MSVYQSLLYGDEIKALELGYGFSYVDKNAFGSVFLSKIFNGSIFVEIVCRIIIYLRVHLTIIIGTLLTFLTL